MQKMSDNLLQQILVTKCLHSSPDQRSVFYDIKTLFEDSLFYLDDRDFKDGIFTCYEVESMNFYFDSDEVHEWRGIFYGEDLICLQFIEGDIYGVSGTYWMVNPLEFLIKAQSNGDFELTHESIRDVSNSGRYVTYHHEKFNVYVDFGDNITNGNPSGKLIGNKAVCDDFEGKFLGTQVWLNRNEIKTYSTEYFKLGNAVKILDDETLIEKITDATKIMIGSVL